MKRKQCIIEEGHGKVNEEGKKFSVFHISNLVITTRYGLHVSCPSVRTLVPTGIAVAQFVYNTTKMRYATHDFLVGNREL